MTLARYTRHTSISLNIGGLCHLGALQYDHQHKEKQRLEESFCSMTLQWDTYLQEIHKAPASLTRVGDALIHFNILGSPVDQVTLLVQGAVKKDKSLCFTQATLIFTQPSLLEVQRDMETLHHENASLAQYFIECYTTSIMTVSESFDNVLQQVEHSNHPLYISRKYDWPNQMLKEGKIVSLEDQQLP